MTHDTWRCCAFITISCGFIDFTLCAFVEKKVCAFILVFCAFITRPTCYHMDTPNKTCTDYVGTINCRTWYYGFSKQNIFVSLFTEVKRQRFPHTINQESVKSLYNKSNKITYYKNQFHTWKDQHRRTDTLRNETPPIVSYRMGSVGVGRQLPSF